MNKKTSMLAIILVGVAVVSVFGLVIAGASSNETVAPSDSDVVCERPMDESNSPWVIDDERLDYIQERLNLTDSQIEEIQTEAKSLIEDGGTQEEIHDLITQKLEEFGVEDLAPRGPGPGSHHERGHGEGECCRR